MTEPDPRQRDALQLARIAAGERDAFERLHRAHYRAVVRLAFGIVGDADEARDVAQEVFVHLLDVAPRWQPNARISTWLHRTTLNAALTMRRRVLRWWGRVSPVSRPPADPEHASALNRTAEQIGLSLEQLSPRQRAVVTLHLDLGMAPSEIAEELDMSANAARLALSKGLRALRRDVGTTVRELAKENA